MLFEYPDWGSGIIISRRPKRRASRENAPGPINDKETQMAALAGLGFAEKASRNAASKAESGFRNPTAMRAAAAMIGILTPPDRSVRLIENRRISKPAPTIPEG